MLDKTLALEAFVDRLADGMTIGVGGWATRRKPMALIRAIARSSLRDLSIVSFGGPDVGLLAANGRLKSVIAGFVSLDHIPLDPHYRRAREEGAIEIMDLDEGMVVLGLRAAAMNLPFLPTRAGLGTDVEHASFRRVVSPYEGSEELLAMPALRLDAALIHVHRADAAGDTVILSPDPFFDDLMARAAKEVFVSTEELVSSGSLDIAANARFNPFERSLVTGVIEAPYGAHPTAAGPNYGLDLDHLKTYASAAAPGAWADYHAHYVDVDPHVYLDAVGGANHVRALPHAIY